MALLFAGDVVLQGARVKSLARAQRWQAAVARASGLVAMGAAIHACEKGGLWDMALQLLRGATRCMGGALARYGAAAAAAQRHLLGGGEQFKLFASMACRLSSPYLNSCLAKSP